MATTARFGARGFTLYRARLVRDGAAPAWAEEAVRGPADVARVMHHLTDDSPQEEFWVFLLNTRHRVVGALMVTRGILDASLIHPREVFAPAIEARAAAIILAHNHPSGDPTASPEDRAVTRQLADAGRVLGIPVLDHLIIGAGSGGGWTSVVGDGLV